MKVEVVRAQPVSPPIDEVVLRLTPLEAAYIAAVCGTMTPYRWNEIREDYRKDKGDLANLVQTITNVNRPSYIYLNIKETLSS